MFIVSVLFDQNRWDWLVNIATDTDPDHVVMAMRYGSKPVHSGWVSSRNGSLILGIDAFERVQTTMADFGNLVQKAFYLGVGAASIAAEKAGSTIQDLREQAQGVADEMVQKGEMNAEEAKKFVNDMVKQAQNKMPNSQKAAPDAPAEQPKEPRRIEILDDEEPETSNSSTKAQEAEELRRQLEELQQELKNLKQ